MEDIEGKEVKLKTFEQSWFEQKMDLNNFLIEIELTYTVEIV